MQAVPVKENFAEIVFCSNNEHFLCTFCDPQSEMNENALIWMHALSTDKAIHMPSQSYTTNNEKILGNFEWM